MIFDFPLSFSSSSWECLLCSHVWSPDYVVFFSGLLLMPVLLWTPLGSHMVSLAPGSVCVHVWLGQLTPSLHVWPSCLAELSGHTALAMPRQCSSVLLCFSSLITPFSMSSTTRSSSPPFSLISSNTLHGMDIFFSKPAVSGEKDLTFGLST